MRSYTKYGLLFLAILALDQFVKYLFETKNISINLGIAILHLVRNTGAGFGILQGQNMILTLISLIAVVVILLNIKSIARSDARFLLPTAMLISGIVGNLIDRIFRGYVVDFIDFRWWPVFNVADSAIFISVIWISTLLILEERKQNQRKEKKIE